MSLKTQRNPNKIELTPHPEWAQHFWERLVSYKDRIVNHPYFRELKQGSLSIDRARRGLIDFYPLVENFPKYMGLILAKTESRADEGHLRAKTWLMQNMRVEQKHADWWVDWAACVGLSREELDRSEPSAMMDAINHYLWHINTTGSIEEGIAATNLAVEWATGEWSIMILEGVKSYAERGLARFSGRTMTWLNAHASYDDEHPYEAMELIKMIAQKPEQQDRAFRAAKRAMEYYELALDDCYKTHQVKFQTNGLKRSGHKVEAESLSS
jgi:pyrroloquinoline quinone (PQQ) biosynthesis protein C